MIRFLENEGEDWTATRFPFHKKYKTTKSGDNKILPLYKMEGWRIGWSPNSKSPPNEGLEKQAVIRFSITNSGRVGELGTSQSSLSKKSRVGKSNGCLIFTF